MTAPSASPAPTVAALIVAAGRGVRAGPGLPKQYRMVGGESVLSRTLRAFQRHPRIARVMVVIHPDDGALFDLATAHLPQSPAIERAGGGAERQESVRLGLEALAAAPPDRVLIHDAARPFVPPAVIDRALAALETHDGACVGLAVADTLRRAAPAGSSLAAAEGTAEGTAEEKAEGPPLCGDLVDRDGLWRAQTPQAFHFGTIMIAHQRFAGERFTDDAEIAARAGASVALVEGAVETAKLTTPADFVWAEQWARLEAAERAPLAAPSARRPDIRVGQGFDVHKFGPNADGSADHVWLCGLKVPHDAGLVGHSDADVGLHALTDAVLGALGAGDIGAHFPPSDERWRGAASDQFLAFAVDLARAAAAEPTLLDVTLICERPKIRPYVAAMRARIAEITGVALRRVSVKATTSEQLGFTGRREGIAALASATLSFAEPF